MNTLKRLLRTVVLTLCIIPTARTAQAVDPTGPIRINQENLAKLSPAEQARVLAIADRLEAITEMDRTQLTREERSALRTETRQLKGEAAAFNDRGPVLYISAVTLLIILLIVLIVT